jgi:hypothetical protein
MVDKEVIAKVSYVNSNSTWSLYLLSTVYIGKSKYKTDFQGDHIDLEVES